MTQNKILRQIHMTFDNLKTTMKMFFRQVSFLDNKMSLLVKLSDSKSDKLFWMSSWWSKKLKFLRRRSRAFQRRVVHHRTTSTSENRDQCRNFHFRYSGGLGTGVFFKGTHSINEGLQCFRTTLSGQIQQNFPITECR